MQSDTDQQAVRHLKKEIKSDLKFTKTVADHVSVFVIRILGSIGFLCICLLFFTGWITCNLNLLPGITPFDPFPFPILNMVVSLFAIVLSVFVLINQNRQGRIDQIKQQLEFEVNVRAESEITKVLTMLHEIHQRMGLSSQADTELEEMKEHTDITQLHQAIDADRKHNL